MKNSRRKSTANNFASYQALESRQMLATYTVNTTLDSASAVPDGLVSLREAIVAANTNSAFGDAAAGDSGSMDVIEFDFGRAEDSRDIIRIALQAGPLEITESLRISQSLDFEPEQLTILGMDVSRVFQLDSAGQVEFQNFAVARGMADEGAGILSTTTDLMLNDVALNRNIATVNGGAILARGGSVSSQSSLFGNNRAEMGGALYLENGAELDDLNSRFTLNTTTGTGGGAIASDSSTVSLEGSDLTINRVTVTEGASGGAIYMTGTANTSLSDVRFSYNNARLGSGGAIFSDSSGTLEIQDSLFAFNDAGLDGGTIYMEDGQLNILEAVDPLDVNNTLITTIRSGTAANGGGLALIRTDANIAGLTVAYTFAGRSDSLDDGMGGGIFSVNSDLKLMGSNVHISGTSYHAGGGIAVIGGSLTMNSGFQILESQRSSIDRHSGFEGSSITGEIKSSDSNSVAGLKAGAGVYAIQSNVKISGVQITGEIEATESGRGGGMFVANSTAILSDLLVADSSAPTAGGGIFASNVSRFRMIDSVFRRNAAHLGGAIQTSGATSAFIATSTFSRGRAFVGGAITNNGVLTVQRSDFEQNIAALPLNASFGFGGAVYSNGDVNFQDTVFSSNQAKVGGAIAGTGTTRIRRSEFSGNTALKSGSDNGQAIGGAISSNADLLSMLDVQFTANQATSGGAVSFSGDRLFGTRLIFGGIGSSEGNRAESNRAQVAGTGGALRLAGTANAILSRSQFINNSASSYGGAIGLVANQAGTPSLLVRDSSRFIFNASTVTSVSAPGDAGGGAIANFGSEMDIRDTLFANNSSDGSGGGIFNLGENAMFQMRSVEIRDNESGLNGGGIFNDAELVSFDSMIFDNLANVEGDEIFEGPNGNSTLIRTQIG